ncbi:MAG: hypothetical protein IPG39_04305 [Bacteroidetes bacterium]|nr:hypothetical protein [Bacteroidota bacterium]
MLKRLLPQTGFARNVLTLFTGASIAQAIPILISPILTRLYPVSDFAVLTLITSLVTLLGILVSGRYEMAIMAPETDKDAKQVVFLTIMLSVVLSAFFLVIFWFSEADCRFTE